MCLLFLLSEPLIPIERKIYEADILFSPLPAFINKWDFLFGNMKPQ